MLFAMEVILGNFAIRHLNAVVVASVQQSAVQYPLMVYSVRSGLVLNEQSV